VERILERGDTVLKYSRLSVNMVEDEDFTNLGQLRSSNIEFISRIMMEKEHRLLVVVGIGNSMIFFEKMGETTCQTSIAITLDEFCRQLLGTSASNGISCRGLPLPAKSRN
jgi:hypothetical protein